MTENLSEQLLTLSGVDAKIVSLKSQHENLIRKRDIFSQEVQDRRSRLAECETAHREGTLKQVLEEHRLRDEHEKIVERRKQLMSLGGAKVAKVLEREIDVASRSLGAMEERAMKALEEVDVLETELKEFRESLEQLEAQFESDTQESEETLKNLEKNLEKLANERLKAIDEIDVRLLQLYDKVKNRYPGDAVAKADGGSCRSCYRALPPQTYNQVLAGNMLIQCPGCRRLLVHTSPPDVS